MTEQFDANRRLATYGSLAPGRPNHHHLESLDGSWVTGHVRGHLIQEGWGADLGFPALTVDPTGPVVEVHVFESPDLPRHWQQLDEFEGPGYERVPITVHTRAGELQASIYALRRPAGDTLGP